MPGRRRSLYNPSMEDVVRLLAAGFAKAFDDAVSGCGGYGVSWVYGPVVYSGRVLVPSAVSTVRSVVSARKKVLPLAVVVGYCRRGGKLYLPRPRVNSLRLDEQMLQVVLAQLSLTEYNTVFYVGEPNIDALERAKRLLATKGPSQPDRVASRIATPAGVVALHAAYDAIKRWLEAGSTLATQPIVYCARLELGPEYNLILERQDIALAKRFFEEWEWCITLVRDPVTKLPSVAIVSRLHPTSIEAKLAGRITGFRVEPPWQNTGEE